MMFNFLKICGIGILAVLLSPLWITFFALMIVVLLVTFILMTFKVLFYDIRNFFVKDKDSVVDPLGDLPEDYEVRRILAAREKADLELIVSEEKDDTPIEVDAIDERKETKAIEVKDDDETKDDNPRIEFSSSLDLSDGGEE